MFPTPLPHLRFSSATCPSTEARMTSHALADAFESAKKEFLSQLPKGIPSRFEEFTTINEVYKAAEEIQAAQASTRTRRNLGKIRPFLECLRQYGKVIDTIVAVKPDVLALIWVRMMPRDNSVQLLTQLLI